MAAVQLPQHFSWCSTGRSSMCTPSWNQHQPDQYCGSCWAHATLTMLADRLKIRKGGGMDVMLSRQSLLNCASFHGHGDGCNGGEPIDVRCPHGASGGAGAWGFGLGVLASG